MMRDPVAVREPLAPSMSCEDARDWFAALLGGQIALTEWALVEAHLRQCAECRQEEARLQQLAAARRFVTQPRAVLDSLGKAMEVTRIGVARSTALVVRHRALLTAAALELTPRAIAGVMQAVSLGIGHSADLIARLRALLAIALELTARTIAGAIQAIGLGITRFVAGIAHLRALLAIPLRLSVRAVANTIEALRLGIPRSVKRVARLCSLPAIPFRSSLRAAGAVLALAFALYALQRTYGPQQHARLAAPPGRELEATQLVPFLPPPSVEQRSVSRAPSRIDDPRQSPSRASVLSSPRVPASEAARGASLPPVPVRGSMVSATHVVGRLSANDRSAAERDFTALLAGVGGTELGRKYRVRFMAVQVVVPQSRYHEFAHGLARIGSWRLEAARFPLPDAVHMTIHVSKGAKESGSGNHRTPASPRK